MKRISLTFILVFLFFFSAFNYSYASLVVIEKDGKITWNVLSEEDSIALDIPQHSYLEVKKVAEMTPSASSTVTLNKTDEKFRLVVSSGNETKELDVNNWQNDLVEIEERAETQKLTVGIKGDKFTLRQKGVTAETSYPVSIDSKRAQLSVLTPSGAKFISVFPSDAVAAALRTNIMNRMVGKNIEVFEEEQELQYRVTGEKVFKFLKTYEYKIPVTLFVSASTGEVLDLDAPGWFKYVSFLFT